MTRMEAANRATPPGAPPRPGRFRLTRELYHQLAERGAFEGVRVELLEGEIIVMAPMDEAHAYPLQELNRRLTRALPDEYRVRPQLPLATDEENEPEPDLAVVATEDVGGDEAPARALLVIEVAHSSVKDDLQRKLRIYARAGVPEYWVIDVKKKELVIHRSPSGSRYRSVRRVTELSSLSPAALPGLALDLRGIFLKR